MLDRVIGAAYLSSLEQFPVTGLIGPRQIGKTTLAKQRVGPYDMLYLDLEKTSDLNKLQDPELFLTQHENKTVILDEVHYLPELFPLLRALVDGHRRPGRFVVLGSASPELLRQSSESLAGRINYLELFPLSVLETQGIVSHEKLWLNGGYPEPALSVKPRFIQSWYRSFIQSYVQRDLPMYGLPADPRNTHLLLQMIASGHGSILNYSSYAKSLGLTVPTIKTYIGFLANAFLITLLQPWHFNRKKRLIKSPKIYIRDSGMLHYLSGITSQDALFGNLLVGNSWEGFVIAQIMSVLQSDDEPYYYRTQDGAEIDFLVRRSNQWLIACEIKLTNAPVIGKGTYIAMEDLGIKQLHVVTPNADNYPIAKNIEVTSLGEFLKYLAGM